MYAKETITISFDLKKNLLKINFLFVVNIKNDFQGFEIQNSSWRERKIYNLSLSTNLKFFALYFIKTY